MGLEKIKNFAKKLNSLTLSELIGYAYDDREFLDEVVGYNQEQLLDGRLSNDVYLPKYSEASQREYGKPNIRIQLKDTGDFYRSLKARRNGNEIIFTGTLTRKMLIWSRNILNTSLVLIAKIHQRLKNLLVSSLWKVYGKNLNLNNVTMHEFEYMLTTQKYSVFGVYLPVSDALFFQAL